jgi:hypothetical protein
MGAGHSPSEVSVDAYLGPGESRFFGEGFKRVRHELRGIAVFPAGNGEPTRVDAVAGISFPANWSRKGDTAQRPHLSTIDVLVLGAQLAEVAVVHSRGLDATERRGMRLRQVRIRAGRRPAEEGLDEAPVSGRVVASYAADVPGTSLTIVACSIATLTVSCTVHHATGRPVGAAASFDSLEDALGDPALRTYGAAYKSVRQVIGDIDIAGDNLSATASVRFEPTKGGTSDRTGLDAGVIPSLVDVFVTGLQLGQVLLYRLDQLPRTKSNTLWMRRTVLKPGPAPTDQGQDDHQDDEHVTTTATVTLENPHLLPVDGETWRSSDIIARVGGATMRCSVAHLLPPVEVPT